MNVAPKAIAEGSKVNASPCCDIELPIWEIVKSSVANPISSSAAQLISSIEVDRILRSSVLAGRRAFRQFRCAASDHRMQQMGDARE